MTAADFYGHLPAFKNAHKDRVDYWIAQSDEAFDTGLWGQLSQATWDRYRSYWVAHNLLLEGSDGNAVDGNDITSEETEHRTISRSETRVQAQATNDYERTTFGQRYRQKARQLGRGGAVTGGC